MPTPEMQLVLLGSRLQADSVMRGRMRQAAAENPDWQAVYNISVHHRVLPVLYRSLKAVLPDVAPGPVLKQFKNAYMANAGQNMIKTACLIRAVDALAGRDIAVLPFKGPAQAEYVYGDISLRSFTDLDILVKKKDAARAREVLLASGFSGGLPLDRQQMDKYIQTEDNFSVFSKKHGVVVELHWEISGCYLIKPLRFEDLPQSPNPVFLHDHPMPTLSREALLVYLCIHSAKDVWGNLEQVMAVAELVREKGPINWALADDMARRWGCRRVFLLGLYLASGLLDAPVSDEMIRHGRRDRVLVKMGDRIAKKLLGPEEAKSAAETRFSGFHIRFRDSVWEMPRYALRLAFRPTEQEWRHFPVPAQMAFLHWFLRPLRLIRSGFARI